MKHETETEDFDQDHWTSESPPITNKALINGINCGLANGLPATLYRLTSPKMKHVRAACLNTYTGITKGMVDHYRVAEIQVGQERIYLLFGTSHSATDIIYYLQNNLTLALYLVVSVVYDGKQYDWYNPVGSALITGVEHKVKPSLSILMFGPNQKGET
jgi:hypothetical protein